MNKTEVISVIGTGNYGLAIGKRLIQYGFKVAFGSRKPDYDYVKECLNLNQEQSKNDTLFSVTSIGDSWSKADNFVFFAVSAKDDVYESVTNELIKSTSKGSNKTIIELSNLNDDIRNPKTSNAERLDEKIKSKLYKSGINNATINTVKGFNLVNAYSMSSAGYAEIKGSVESIPLAGDDLRSKEQVIKLCSRIGFQGVDVGGLKNALELELSNRSTFSEWYYPSVLSLAFFLFNFVWIFAIYYLFPKKPHTFQKYMNDFSLLGHTNKVLGFTALQILAFVYLGSVVASVYQLKNGTKYKRFPRFLDNWLKTRKQLGLWAFYLASFHVVTTMFATNSSYLADWYRKVDEKTAPNSFGLTTMTINGELNILTGIIAYLIMVLVALSSVNSIANSLNWSEWRFVQSNLGLGCLAMGLLHDIFMYLRIYLEKDEKNYSVVYLITRVKLIAIYFPLFVVLSRFVFSYFPPLCNRIEDIRNGSIAAKNQKSKQS
jgi:predicted dinucleotide-binding enzyme/DMSO/TMAO reductase YedYZ heme-binding membrane subunit